MEFTQILAKIQVYWEQTQNYNNRSWSAVLRIAIEFKPMNEKLDWKSWNTWQIMLKYKMNTNDYIIIGSIQQ